MKPKNSENFWSRKFDNFLGTESFNFGRKDEGVSTK